MTVSESCGYLYRFTTVLRVSATVIVIGLTPVTQEVVEGEGAIVNVEILFGSLQRDVLLSLTTVGENATGM